MWIMETLRADTRKAIFTIHTGTTIFAGIGCTFINLHVAQGTCEAWFADAIVTVDAITANAIITGVAGTVIEVHLTIHT